MRSAVRHSAVAVIFLITLAGCGASAGSSGSAGPNAPTPSGPISLETACPSGPASSPPPFAIGGEYGVVPREGGVDNPPSGAIAVSDWEVTRSGACLADVVVFVFATESEAASFAKDQAETVGLASGSVAGTTVWTSASGDGARLAIGTAALSISMEDPDPATLLAVLTSIVLATSL